MILTNIFDVEEKELINRITQDEAIQKFSRQNLLTALEFNLSINTDRDVLDLCEGLKSKINDLTEAEWENMRAFLPFELAYTSGDQPPQEENEQAI